MGTMTFTQMKSELGFLLSNRNDVDSTNPARVERWINQAYTYMCHPSVHPFREMQSIDTITLATSDNDYAIATLNSNTVVAIRFVTYIQATAFTNTAAKRKVNPRSIRFFEQRTLTTGPPSQYAIDGSSLFISPVPRSNENNHLLRVGYYQEPTILDSGTDVTVLPSYYDRPLMKLTQAFAETDLGDRELAMLTTREAGQLLNNANSEMQMEGEDSGFQIEVVLQPVMGI